MKKNESDNLVSFSFLLPISQCSLCSSHIPLVCPSPSVPMKSNQFHLTFKLSPRGGQFHEDRSSKRESVRGWKGDGDLVSCCKKKKPGQIVQTMLSFCPPFFSSLPLFIKTLKLGEHWQQVSNVTCLRLRMYDKPPNEKPHSHGLPDTAASHVIMS